MIAIKTHNPIEIKPYILFSSFQFLLINLVLEYSKIPLGATKAPSDKPKPYLLNQLCISLTPFKTNWYGKTKKPAKPQPIIYIKLKKLTFKQEIK